MLLMSLHLSCAPPVVVEGPPSLSASLAIDHETFGVGSMLADLASSQSGVAAVRRSIMLQVLKQRSAALGKSSPPNDFTEWQDRLAAEDQVDLILYAWAAQIIDLKSVDEKSLKERFELEYPDGYEFIGRQINLTPRAAWTEDHYQRQLGALRSAARLKLSQLRHQVIEGKRFEELASQHSHHLPSRTHGGRISIDELRAEGRESKIIRAAQGLRFGEISPILQDERGMYLFTNVAEPIPMTLDAEGIFIPQSIMSSGLHVESLWKLLEALCDQSFKCQIEDLLPQGPIGQRWRDVWNSRLKSSERAKRSKKKKRSRRHRLDLNAKGDTRSLTGRERSWSDLTPRILEEANAEYHSHVDPKIMNTLRSSDRVHYLERAPLFRALPLIVTEHGAWVFRLRGRTVIPAIATPQLRMIHLDLTREGLQSHWGSWGVESVGELLTESVTQNRLDEALSTLGIQGSPISPKSLKPSLLKEMMNTSLHSGPRLITHQGGSDWILIKLDEKRKVTFEERSQQIVETLQTERIKPEAIRGSLRSLWQSLKIEFHIDRKKVDFSIAEPIGFTREPMR